MLLLICTSSFPWHLNANFFLTWFSGSKYRYTAHQQFQLHMHQFQYIQSYEFVAEGNCRLAGVCEISQVDIVCYAPNMRQLLYFLTR